MSYNIDSVDIIAAKNFTIAHADLDQLREDMERSDQMPESNVFDQVGEWQSQKNIDSSDTRWKFDVGIFWWGSEGSGWAYEALKGKILPRFTGSADLVILWERGDSYTGLRVRDGKVTEHEVVRSLGKEVKR